MFIALDDVPNASECLQFVAGSHAGPELPSPLPPDAAAAMDVLPRSSDDGQQLPASRGPLLAWRLAAGDCVGFAGKTVVFTCYADQLKREPSRMLGEKTRALLFKMRCFTLRRLQKACLTGCVGVDEQQQCNLVALLVCACGVFSLFVHWVCLSTRCTAGLAGGAAP